MGVQLDWVEDARIPPHTGLAGEEVAVLNRKSEPLKGASIEAGLRKQRLNETCRAEQKPSAFETSEIEHASSSSEPLLVARQGSEEICSSNSSEEGLTGMPAATLESTRNSRAVSPGGASHPDLGPGGPPWPEHGRHTELTQVDCTSEQASTATAKCEAAGARTRTEQQHEQQHEQQKCMMQQRRRRRAARAEARAAAEATEAAKDWAGHFS